MINKTISHYKILEKIGEGGMGVVYKAEDTKLKRIVALKFLPPEFNRDKEAKKRFLNEARSAAAIEHSNICPVYEINEDDNQLFIVMSYMDGQTLMERINQGPIEIEESLRIITQITDGLSEAHENNIIHRDIKSANIFITKKNVAKILDFGLAKLRGHTKLTKENTTLGTIAYMSPEQTTGEEVKQSSDIWSLGVVFYEMLTGQLPFRGHYEQAVIFSILNEEPEPVSELIPDVPMQLEQIIKKMLAKDPNERYQVTADLVVDLRNINKESRSGVKSVKKELRQKVLKKLSRKLFTPGSLTLLAIFIVCAFIVFKGIANKEPSKTEVITQVRKIAVLPFEDMSPQKDQEYFCDGISEELINRLAKLSGFRVTARTSAFSFKGKNLDIPSIGKKLKVDIILEGSVRKEGNKLRITAQLITVSDGFHLWSETYNRRMEDVFAIQDEISLSIVERLKVSLLKKERSKLKLRHTKSVEAYNLYLKGRYYWNKRSEEAFQKGMEHFQLAIERDPNYALAYAGIADCYILLQVYAYLSPKEALPKARAAAEKALEINSSMAEAHTSLAWVKWSYDLDRSAGEKEFKRVLELNPSYATGHHWYAIYLTAMGRHDESLAQIKQAQELDPLSLMISIDVGFVLFYGRKDDLAIEQYQKTIEMDKSFVVSYWRLAMIYAQKEMYNEALVMTQNMKKLLGDNDPLFLTTLGYVYSLSGKRDEAKKVLKELSELSKQRYISPLRIALIYMGLGQKDQTFKWLEKAYEERDFWMTLIKTAPPFERLRSDPRFKKLLKKMNLE